MATPPLFSVEPGPPSARSGFVKLGLKNADTAPEPSSVVVAPAVGASSNAPHPNAHQCARIFPPSTPPGAQILHGGAAVFKRNRVSKWPPDEGRRRLPVPRGIACLRGEI